MIQIGEEKINYSRPRDAHPFTHNNDFWYCENIFLSDKIIYFLPQELYSLQQDYFFLPQENNSCADILVFFSTSAFSPLFFKKF